MEMARVTMASCVRLEHALGAPGRQVRAAPVEVHRVVPAPVGAEDPVAVGGLSAPAGRPAGTLPPIPTTVGPAGTSVKNPNRTVPTAYAVRVGNASTH